MLNYTHTNWTWINTGQQPCTSRKAPAYGSMLQEQLMDPCISDNNTIRHVVVFICLKDVSKWNCSKSVCIVENKLFCCIHSFHVQILIKLSPLSRQFISIKLHMFIVQNVHYCIPSNFHEFFSLAYFAIGFNRKFKNAVKFCCISFVDRSAWCQRIIKWDNIIFLTKMRK